MAAVLGGTQSLHCNGRDEALGLPTEASAQIALRTQQIIAAETGVTNTVDPVAGSWAVEQLTDKIEREAITLIDSIEGQGGALNAIESGFIQREIQESAYRAQQSIENEKAIVVGVNRYGANDSKETVEGQRIDPRVEQGQTRKLAELRATRDEIATNAALRAVQTAAQETTNLVQPIIDAVEANATVGEIANSLRNVFGEYQEQT